VLRPASSIIGTSTTLAQPTPSSDAKLDSAARPRLPITHA
jgi:hypothetical protein